MPLTNRSFLAILNLGASAALLTVVVTSAMTLQRYVAPPNADTGTDLPVLTIPADRSRTPVGEIIAAHLFGRPAQSPAPVQQATVPTTRLNLTLAGVVASADPRVARAIIANGNGPLRNYAVGEMLEQTDLRLHAIHAGEVVIERGGKLESLAIRRSSLNSLPPGQRPSGQPNRTSARGEDDKPEAPGEIPLMREPLRIPQDAVMEVSSGTQPS